MPEEIISRILRLPGYGGYAWEAEETTNTLTLWVRQTAAEASYVCSGCGISVRDVHSWTERRVRDLPWGPWQVWLVVEVHRVRCRRCGVRTERLPFLTGKVHCTTRLELAEGQRAEGIHHALEIDPPHALDGSDVIGVLAEQTGPRLSGDLPLSSPNSYM